MLELQYNRLSQYDEYLKRNSLSDKEQLMGGGEKKRRIVFGESDETTNLDNGQILQLQNDKMKEQDERLHLIGGTISRQKQLAKDIHDETEIHLNILDDIDSRIENTTKSVMKGTRQVDRLQHKASTCSWWVVIGALGIIIAALTISIFV